MSEPVIQSIIGATGIVIVALITIITARLSGKAARASAKVEERYKLIEGYDKLVDDLQTQNGKLTENLHKLTERFNVLDEEVKVCRNRITELETERDRTHRDFSKLVRYCKILIQIMRENNLEVPEQPLEILDYGA